MRRRTMDIPPHRGMGKWLRALLRSERAASALEYAILVAIVVGGIGAAIAGFRTNITTAITSIGTDVETVAGTVTTGS